MKLTSNGVPILQKNEFDEEASRFLRKNCAEALMRPMKVPIEDIAINELKLKIERVHLTDDLSILGQICFSDGRAVIYLKDTDESIYVHVEKGTMLIDPDVAIKRNVGSERNTIAHECVHWSIHRQYYSMQIQAGSEHFTASRCPVNPPSEQNKPKWTEDDWMEWHANGIAPKILMPAITFRQYVLSKELYEKHRNRRQEASSVYLDLLLADLAEFYEVSKQSAHIRLSELGLI